MKKLLILGTVELAVVVLVLVSCALPALAPAPTPEPSGESLTQHSFTLGRYFWPKPDWAPDEPSLGEVPADNPEGLRLLTNEEKDRVAEIALDTPEASSWREKEPEYRAELIWYTPQDSQMLSFGYYYALYRIYDELYWRPGSLPKSAMWYPGVRIGFGIPQQFVVEAAVDLETGEVVYVNSYSDVHRKSNLRWLTDDEKNTVIEIALNTPEAKKWLEKESTHSVGLTWQAIWEGGYRVFPYEAVEEGIPLYVLESELEVIYPNISICFGEPAEWIVSVVIDLDTKE
ncbi:unnamed protein product, partial [marine sediment metagenome]